ncbi:hypothetical protein [Vampirovibrio sp.]|uniref:hypothetical protein n=1 Tax=Vampirovibrio sp. TaxID=2717857 RepID=UPI00359402C5
MPKAFKDIDQEKRKTYIHKLLDIGIRTSEIVKTIKPLFAISDRQVYRDIQLVRKERSLDIKSLSADEYLYETLSKTSYLYRLALQQVNPDLNAARAALVEEYKIYQSIKKEEEKNHVSREASNPKALVDGLTKLFGETTNNQ